MNPAIPLKLSIVIPVYNEKHFLGTLLERVMEVDYEGEFEVIAVDDGSSDGSAEELERVAARYNNIRCLKHERNRGKGAALRTGFQAVSGDIIIVQDADLEYDPKEIPKVLGPIRKGDADVVFGSRFLSAGPHRVLYFWHSVGNNFLTLLSNLFTNLNLTDMEVCYKAMRREVLNSFTLKEDRFGIEPEITAKVARGGWRIYEVPISYYGRTYTEGKKITWKDGWRALWSIVKYNLFSS
jgi:glycosyltransferase involved in cell wall biosynthesis